MLCRSFCLTCSVGLLALLSGGCGGTDHAAEHHSGSESQAAIQPFVGQYPIQVVATTGPVADLVRNVGGDHLQVTGLMGPGVDPHLYRPVPSDIEQLNSADAIFYNGMHLEGRMADLFIKLARRRPIFAVTGSLVESADTRLREPPEFQGHYDPHVWHDPQLWSDCVRYVADVLSELDPSHAADYKANADTYTALLAETDTYCHERLSEIPQGQRVLVSAHDAFGYFCIAYELESMPLGGVSTDEEVSIGRMDEVVQYLVDRQVKAVFVESAVAPRIVEALVEPCKKAGHDVKIGGELYADALGAAGSGAETYTGMIRANVDTIVDALK